MKYVKRSVAIVISILILAYLFTIIDISDIRSALSTLSASMIIVGGLFYLLSYVFRALRFRDLIDQKISFFPLFWVVCLHNFLNNMFPAKTGEVSYVLLLRKKNILVGKSMGSLILARVFDFFLLFIIFMLMSLYFVTSFSISYLQILLILFILGIIILLPFIILKKKALFLRFVSKCLNIVNIKEGTTKTILEKIDESIEALRHISKKNVVLKGCIWTLLIVLSQIGFYFSILHGLGGGISVIQVFVASFIVFILGTLPIQGIAGFGTYEGIWAIALGIVGVGTELAITSGFVVHIMQIMFFVILGAVGFFGYKR